MEVKSNQLLVSQVFISGRVVYWRGHKNLCTNLKSLISYINSFGAVFSESISSVKILRLEKLMKIREFFDQTNTPEQLKNFITSNNLLIPPICCNYEIKIQLYRSTKLRLIFRCNKCNKKISIFKPECFKGMKINLQNFFDIVYFIVYKVSITETVTFLGIHRKTISDYYFSFRNIISVSLINTNTILSGLDRIV